MIFKPTGVFFVKKTFATDLPVLLFVTGYRETKYIIFCFTNKNLSFLLNQPIWNQLVLIHLIKAYEKAMISIQDHIVNFMAPFF